MSRFVRASAVELHMDISEEPFRVDISSKNIGRCYAVEMCMDMSQETFCVELWRENAGHPCLASLRSRHAHGHFRRTICVEIYKVNAGRYCVTPRFMRACALQMCILCVEIYRDNDGCHID